MADDFDYDPNNDEQQQAEEQAQLEQAQMDEEQQMLEAQQQAEEQAERRRENNRLKKILKTAPWRFYPHLTIQEQNFLRRMKKKGHGNEVRAIESAVDLRKQAFKIKANTALTTGAPFIGIFALIIFIIIAIIVIVATLFPFLFPDDSAGGSKGTASPFGMKGDMFYGGRFVYKDEVLSRNGLIEQYVDIVETSVENLQAQTYTEIVKGEGEDDVYYDVRLTLNLTLPADDFNYEKLDLTQFQTDYVDLYNIVGEIAKVAYKVDNNVTEAPADLIETLDGIKYFGFNEQMIGSNIDDTTDNIIEIIYSSLAKTEVISIEEKLATDSDVSNYVPATNATLESLDEEIRENILQTGDAIDKVRAEKLFIKDYILEDAESYMEGIEKKNYVALIYMSKENVDFSYVSYTITIDKNADFAVTLTNNGSEITLTKGEGENLGNEEETSELSYMFKTSENLKQVCNTTTIIDVSNLKQFTNGSSLFKVVSKASDYTIYLEETTDENDEKVLTFKTGNMYATFETDMEFYFNEEIKYGE